MTHSKESGVQFLVFPEKGLRHGPLLPSTIGNQMGRGLEMEKEGGSSYAGINTSVIAYRRSPGLVVKSPSSALMSCALLWDHALIRCASESALRTWKKCSSARLLPCPDPAHGMD